MTGKKPAKDPQADLRKKWKEAVQQMDAPLHQEPGCDEDGKYAPYVDWQQFSGLLCGATGKRTGQPCKRKDLYASGRCKFHGGLSTGPTSEAGKERSAQNEQYRRSRQPPHSLQTLNEPVQV